MTENIVTEKYCPRCKAVKSRDDFVKRPGRKCGLAAYCKSCAVARTREWREAEENRDTYRAMNKRRYHENKDYYKQNNLRFRCKEKGIEVEDFRAMMAQQNGKCAICGSDEQGESIAIDHCHTTGKVRGLLCTSCNAGLGFFKDNPHFLERAFHYLSANS